MLQLQCYNTTILINWDVLLIVLPNLDDISSDKKMMMGSKKEKEEDNIYIFFFQMVCDKI